MRSRATQVERVSIRDKLHSGFIQGHSLPNEFIQQRLRHGFLRSVSVNIFGVIRCCLRGDAKFELIHLFAFRVNFAEGKKFHGAVWRNCQSKHGISPGFQTGIGSK